MRIRLVLVLVAVSCLAVVAQAGVQITVYNDNLALVKDTRTLEFKKGNFELSFADVAAAIDPTSVAFSVVGQSKAVTLLEQNYRYDLVSADKILQKYLDRPIRIVTRQDKVHDGTLLAADKAALTLQTPDSGIKIVSRKQVADLSLARLPEGLITRPTLVWMLNSSVAGPTPAEVRYLTHRIDWHAEYVATVSADEGNLELAGWVSIDNQTGATYNDATIKLIAGDVHLVPERPSPLKRLYVSGVSITEPLGGFQQKEFFEYHMYTLQRSSTLRDNEIKQIALFDPAKVATRKVFTYDGAAYDKKVRVTMEFVNSESSGLGIPLPKGKIRVMKADTDGSLEFIGEDAIEHTAKDEKVRVFVGNAFDVVGERTQKEHRQIATNTSEDNWEIVIRNHKSIPVSIVIVEHFWGDWAITKTTAEFVKKDARTAEWKIDVPKDGETKVLYTVRQTS